jgi:hypothetical protein
MFIKTAKLKALSRFYYIAASIYPSVSYIKLITGFYKRPARAKVSHSVRSLTAFSTLMTPYLIFLRSSPDVTPSNEFN